MFSDRTPVLQRLGRESSWYRLAIAVSIGAAAIDGWLTPPVIEHHAWTGELNPISAYHIAGPAAFGFVRVGAVLLVLSLVAELYRRDGRSGWTGVGLALIAAVNAANGSLATASVLAGLVTGEVHAAWLIDASAVGAGIAAATGMVWCMRGDRLAASVDRLSSRRPAPEVPE